MGPDAMDINFFKKLTDRYPIQVPVKGSFAPWCARVIIVTSNYPMQTWWPKASAEDFNAVARRVKIFDFDVASERLSAANWARRVRDGAGGEQGPPERARDPSPDRGHGGSDDISDHPSQASTRAGRRDEPGLSMGSWDDETIDLTTD